MTKKVERKINKCIEEVADRCSFLLSKFDEQDYYKDPAASLEKLAKVVSSLGEISGVADENTAERTGVILLPSLKEDT